MTPRKSLDIALNYKLKFLFVRMIAFNLLLIIALITILSYLEKEVYGKIIVISAFIFLGIWLDFIKRVKKTKA